MFPQLPEEIERMIWKLYFTGNVIKYVKNIRSIWFKPSNKITKLCKDWGCIQFKHTDLEKVLFEIDTPSCNMVYEECFDKLCGNCVFHGFPCINASVYGGFKNKLIHQWNMEFYQNKL